LALLAARRQQGEMRALVGARSKNDVLCGEDFSRSNVPVEVATEDGSYGHRGLVTDLLRRHLELAAKNKNPSRVFSCGPLPMLRAVAQLCIQKNVPCQVSLEENMPCGVGICNGCVVPVVGAGDEYGRYRRVCVEGPVMRAQEIDWLHES
jgi:dihydroorotate dehydrogenase electron transfer subunit